ncbi:ABC transporter ATP-binding protein [Pseudogemmobacter humi]|nr:ABC transporter ATP-binding protein [Pseudogemmobacter humi]
MNGPGVSTKPKMGAGITVRNLSRHYGTTKAVDDVSFSVEAGEFLTLLGSSGSGKSTTLMMIAGLVEPSAGQILIDGKDVSQLVPEKRNLGVVFQSYALFPHMNVFDNVAFPLKMRGISRAEIERRVKATLEMVELDSRRGYRVGQLSGGQQQRIALARALVFEPPVLLMDEPMGALDRRLREQLQREVKEIQQSLGITVIYVTHDQEEAMLMSDRVGIMAEGRMQQIGAPREIYEAPRTPFVAAFLGESNFLRVRQTATGWEVCPDGAANSAGSLEAMVRPEDLHLLSPGQTAALSLEGVVRYVEFPGGAMRLLTDTPAGPVEVRLHRHEAGTLREGERVTLGWSDRDMVLFGAEGRARQETAP